MELQFPTHNEIILGYLIMGINSKVLIKKFPKTWCSSEDSTVNFQATKNHPPAKMEIHIFEDN